jgi:hypothetical protein
METVSINDAGGENMPVGAGESLGFKSLNIKMTHPILISS